MRDLLVVILVGRGGARVLEFLGIAAAAGFIIWCTYFALRSAKARGRRAAQRSPHPPEPQTEFIPLTLASTLEPLAPTGQPGTFLVKGVGRESGRDIKELVSARSPADAKAKAESRGVAVTSVERTS